MSRTTLSPKFQVVIPKDVREALKLEPGTAFNVTENHGHIQLFPIRSAKQMRGFLRGIDSSVPRDKDRVGTWSIPQRGWNILRMGQTPIFSRPPSKGLAICSCRRSSVCE